MRFFVISKNKLDKHHPDRELWPNWTVALPSSLHRVIAAIEGMETTEANYALLTNFEISVFWQLVRMRRELDEN